MANPFTRFWQAEIQPALHGVRWPLAATLVLGTALLVNKRYLAIAGVVGAPEARWTAWLAWLLATLVLIAAIATAARRALAGWTALLLGLTALVAVTGLVGFRAPGLPRWVWPSDTAPLVMLALSWLVVVPVLVAGWTTPGGGRPRWPQALTVAALALAITLFMVRGYGPTGVLLDDPRYGQIVRHLLSLLWLMALPMLVSYAQGRTFSLDGGGLGRWRWWLPWTLLFLVVMVLVIFGFASRQPDFVSYYPMYKEDFWGYDPARDGWGFYLAFELTYGLYFLAWEYFFRGWMLFRLEPDLGPEAILVQTVPFVLMHIGKPGPEFASSLVAGVVLGWLAWRSRSFWPCFILHWAASATMNFAAVQAGWQAGGA